VRLAFLGTGSAFSLERYPGAIVVDDHILLDAGAPLLHHLHRVGVAAEQIDVIFLTHFHGDHFLGLPAFLHYRGSSKPGNQLTIVGPRQVQPVIDTLCELSWGVDWPASRKAIPLTYAEASDQGSAASIQYETRLLEHSSVECRGYRLQLGSQVLVYAGDTTVTPALHDLIRGADVVITEATAPSAPGHTSWEEARQLVAAYPSVRFFFNHVSAGSTEHAMSDLEVVEA
jgi:ribonuclease BN (tRNA processing enzyme)